MQICGVFFWSRRLLKHWLHTAKMTPCGALRASPTSSKTQRQETFEFGFVCLIAFCDFAAVTHFAPIRFYKQTSLRTETFTEQFLCADTLARRGLCTDKEVFIHRCFAERRIYTHKNRHTGAFTHRTFYTEKPLHRATFTRRNFYTGKL